MIKELADKLGTTAEHLWAVLVRQAVVEATTNLILFGAVSLVALFFAGWAWVHKDRHDDHEFRPATFIIITLLVGIGGAVLSSEIPQLLNPEYYAFQQIRR